MGVVGEALFVGLTMIGAWAWLYVSFSLAAWAWEGST